MITHPTSKLQGIYAGRKVEERIGRFHGAKNLSLNSTIFQGTSMFLYIFVEIHPEMCLKLVIRKQILPGSICNWEILCMTLLDVRIPQCSHPCLSRFTCHQHPIPLRRLRSSDCEASWDEDLRYGNHFHLRLPCG